MPDVSRSDSQRSDVSQSKPRVSFNRDVHVKRIVPRSDERVAGSLNGDSFSRCHVRKQRLEKSRKQLEDEAAKVLKEARQIKCVASSNKGASKDKYYTLPNRRKGVIDYENFTKKPLRKNSLESLHFPPKKPPRSFITSNDSIPSRVAQEIKQKENRKPKKSNIRRSVSDATNLKSRIFKEKNKDEVDCVSRSDAEDSRNTKRKAKKKQLSPIIEVQQREDYFSKINKNNEEDNKENTETNPTSENCDNSEKKESATESLKKLIEEIDEQLFRDTGKKVQHSETKRQEPEVIIIDVDKAKQISRNKNSKTNVIGKKLKSLTTCKSTGNSKTDKQKNINENTGRETVKKTIKKLEKRKEGNANMMHSSQKPAEKLPLTKGRTVDTMVKRLSIDSPSSPPPKTNILVTPNVSVQHNGNQPFSYTRGISPDKYNGNDPGSPVIYAQVICANGASGQSKQTVHTVFNGNTKKHPNYSDSDEGLGYEEQTNRKYSPFESSFSRKYNDQNMSELRDDDFMDTDEPLINRKSKTTYFNGYSYENTFADIERGRADGMDAKRRESLSESLENGVSKTNNTNGFSNKSDWSARRDLLESRIKHRLNSNSPRDDTNMFNSESTLKYKSNSESPTGYSGVHTNSYVDRYETDSRKKYFGDRKDEVEYVTNGRYPFEQKARHNQINNSRSSPDRRHFETNNFRNDRFVNKIERQQRLTKERAIYQSNPEIYDDTKEPHSGNSYHDSLRREKRMYRSEKYLDHNENERKDRFGDSGIESDIRRDCVDNIRIEPKRMYGIRNVDSEDEGFASSLLIANERHHTEEAVNNRKFSGDYEYDAPYDREEYEYRKRRTEYAPRERSIDDGSHYDPRIDKNFENEKKMMAKKTEKKNSKTGKKSGLEKVKQLFLSSSRKKEKQAMVKEEDLRSRYREYKGSTECLEPQIKKRESRDVNTSYDYRNRRRLPTPSPEPQSNDHSDGLTNGHISDSNISHGWFKSLDRLSRRKSRKDELESFASGEEELPLKSSSKNLRFFGDSLREKNIYNNRSRTNITGRDKIKSQSTRDLHNITEERPSRQESASRNNHRSMFNVSESDRETNRSVKSSLKPPISPSHRARDMTRRDERSRRSKNEVSSLESSTEGDSSQQSQRSVVYLHAATVGDIPGPGFLRTSSRAPSREELVSNSTKIQPTVKTLSRSFSMLAPWKPKHYRESVDIDYSQYPKPIPVPKNGKYEQKAPKNGTSRNSVSSTLKKKAHETKRSNQNISTLNNHRSRSKENISSSQTLKRIKDEPVRTSSSTLYKKKDRLPRENSRYSKDRDDKRYFSKSASVESLGGQFRSSKVPRQDNREVSRSVSMPRDPEKSAGWFRMGKKYKNTSSQHL